MAESVPSAAELRRLRDEREVALLRRFIGGHLLAPSEMAEVQHLLPAAALAAPPVPRPEYAHTYGHYAHLLGCHVRRIKDYVSRAYVVAPPDFPPFDRPADFLAWWRRRMGREPADRVLAFCQSGRPVADAISSAASAAEKPDTSAAASAPPPPPPPADPAKSVLRFEDAGAGGFDASVRELRATVASAQARLKRAMQAEPLDESFVASCSRAVREQLDLLRKAENDLFDMQRKRGELVPLADVREDWRTLLAAMRQMRRRMEDNVSADLAKLTPDQLAAAHAVAFTPEQLVLVRTAVGLERVREEQLLRGSKYWRRPDDVSPAPVAA